MDSKLSLRFEQGLYQCELPDLYKCIQQINDIIDCDNYIRIDHLLGIFNKYIDTRTKICDCNWSEDEMLYRKLKDDKIEKQFCNGLLSKVTFDLNYENNSDPVNHPEHYKTNGIECFDAIKASQGDTTAVNFAVCNAFKYIWRNQHKGAQIQDLKKAVWYLNKAIDILEENEPNER